MTIETTLFCIEKVGSNVCVQGDNQQRLELNVQKLSSNCIGYPNFFLETLTYMNLQEKTVKRFCYQWLYNGDDMKGKGQSF